MGLTCDNSVDSPIAWGLCTKPCSDSADSCGQGSYCIPGGKCVKKCDATCVAGTKCNTYGFCERELSPRCTGAVTSCDTYKSSSSCTLGYCSWDYKAELCGGPPIIACTDSTRKDIRENCTKAPGCTWSIPPL
jgi:hypothetical protein